MPMWKVFLTMEFDGIVEADEEREAVELLEKYIESGMPAAYRNENIKRVCMKRWWGGANEVKDGDM